MLGPIDKINRFRRCAIWHAQGHSEYLEYMVHFVLSYIYCKQFFPWIDDEHFQLVGSTSQTLGQERETREAKERKKTSKPMRVKK